MIDRLFFAALTFCLLTAGTLAAGSAWFEDGRATSAQAHTAMQVVQLPMVEVSGKRVDSGTAVALTDSVEPAARKLQ